VIALHSLVGGRAPVSIVRIAGDGVGPELVRAATAVFAALRVPVDWVDAAAGLGCYEACGRTAPEQTLAALRKYGLAVKGPFRTPSGGTVRSANHYIRSELDLFACVRPLPIDPDRPVLLVRENVEDLYPATEWMRDPDTAVAVKIATRPGCRRIVRHAFELARREYRARVTVVHKANNLKLTEGMLLDIAREQAADYPDIRLDDMLADTACSTMVLDPARFDVIVTSNTFGDLLSNVGGAVAGSLGVIGSLNSGEGIHVAEAAHGDAAELAGLDRVNPVALLDGVRMLLAAMGRSAEASALAGALRDSRAHGPRTLDLGGSARTSELVAFLCERAADRLDRADG
jgi:isocitrate dehydrogenase (NAD+)